MLMRLFVLYRRTRKNDMVVVSDFNYLLQSIRDKNFVYVLLSRRIVDFLKS